MQHGRLGVVGDLVEDVVVWQDGPLRAGSDVSARIFRTRGGSAANVAVAASVHVPTRFVGCVGTDPLGDRLLAELVAAGVELHVQRRGRTGTIAVLVDRDGERTFLSDRGACTELRDLPPAALDQLAVLHVPAYSLHGGSTARAVRRLMDDAVRQRIAVSLDASSWAVLRSIGPADYRDLVARVRPVLLFANADEARELDAGALTREGVTVVVKDGAAPTVVLTPDGGRRTVPVPATRDVRDSTGAGDAFAAGWLSAMMAGLDTTACAERAHAMARRVLGSPGAGGPSRPEEPV